MFFPARLARRSTCAFAAALMLATIGVRISVTASAQTAPSVPACRDTDNNGSVDNDGDGLCDNWEKEGIDFDGDGVIDLRLPGADLNHKDLFQEIDYMQGRAPTQDPETKQYLALEDVRLAFERAPVVNPDGTPGIRLHIQVDEEIPRTSLLRFQTDCPATTPTPTGAVDYCALRTQFFGTSAERAQGAKVLGAKQLAFRYGMYADQSVDGPGTAGAGTVSTRFGDQPGLYGGDDVVMTLGTEAGKRNIESGTFMHELGHNLQLLHGGRDDVGCKPNHLSVMNYNYEVENVPALRRPLDFSRDKLLTLNEGALDERVGVQGPPGRDTVFGPGPIRTVPADGPVDWNRSGVIDAAPVSADINKSPTCDGSGTVLEGSEDWGALMYATAQKSGTYLNASPAQAAAASSVRALPARLGSPRFHRDPTIDQLRQMSPDTDGDGVLNLDDDCVFDANPDQGDADGDGVGNACENDAAPLVTAGPDVSGVTGTPISLHGGVTDDGHAGDDLVYVWDYAPSTGTPSRALCAIADPLSASTAMTCTDPGTFVVTLTATDGVTHVVADSTTVVVQPTAITARCAALERLRAASTDPAVRQQLDSLLAQAACGAVGTTTTRAPTTTIISSTTTTGVLTTTTRVTPTTLAPQDARCSAVGRALAGTSDPAQRQQLLAAARLLSCRPPA